MSRARREVRRRIHLMVLASIALLVTAGGRASGGEQADRRECEYGITLALAGQSARAESVFVSLLSHSRGSPAAFTNLGNLRLLAGDVAGSLGFYARAFAADSSDGGIALNEATALLLLGDEDAAEEHARLGVQLAGDAPRAASLLGLHDPGGSAAATRGAERTRLSKEEVLALIRAAAGRVPADSSHAGAPARAPVAPGRRPIKLRAAGPRAGDAAPPTLVYWKR